MKNALIVANLAGFASFLICDIELLQQMGYRITFAANADKLAWEDTKERLREMGVPHHQIDFDSKNPLSAQNLRAYRQLRKLMKEEQYDLIHCHTPIAGILTRIAARHSRARDTKVIYTTHGLAYTTQSSFKTKLVYKTIEWIGAKLCDAIITINREDYAAAQKLGCKKVYYIHGVGVNTKRFADAEVDREAYRKSIGVENDEVMVLSVGELSERKNHQIVIEALSRMKSGKKYVYVICGNGIDGGTGKMLQEKAQHLGVRLLLLGFRRDIPQVMKCSDVGAIPSIREGLGLAGVQSLAVGVPIVGTDVQGIRDYVVDGQTGYLCGAFDADSIAQRIEELASLGEADRERMATLCRKKALEFDDAVSNQERAEIFNELLQARKEMK